MAGVNVFPVQQYIRTLLVEADVCEGRVYDDTEILPDVWPDVPEEFNGPWPPFVVLSDWTDEADDTWEADGPSFGVEHNLTLRLYSRYRGDKEIKDQTAAIRRVLHQQSWYDIDGLESVTTRVSTAVTRPDIDGLTQQVMINVECVCRE